LACSFIPTPGSPLAPPLGYQVLPTDLATENVSGPVDRGKFRPCE
jgi:hypothetical protein